ncbi:MAG: hypothetical protein JO175_05605 [Candidatus Eremiobacteraeota bacterium]|nr:hypothetical protein [Candidatus Eremiobacteraeota bacterium]
MAIHTRPSHHNCHRSQPRNRIRYFVAPNENKRAGGFCPLYTFNNQRLAYIRKRAWQTHGNTFCRGYDKATAIKMAKAAAMDEAERHYGGDDCTTVVYSATGSTRFAGSAGSKRGYRKPKLKVGSTYYTPHGWMSVHFVDTRAAGGRGQVIAYSEGKKYIWDLPHFNAMRF